MNSQSGPTPAGFNSSGHSNDSNLPIRSPPTVRAPVRDGLLGGQPRGQPVRVQHIPDHTNTPREQYGPVSKLGTRHFLVGPDMGEEFEVPLEKGKLLTIKTLTPGIQVKEFNISFISRYKTKLVVGYWGMYERG